VCSERILEPSEHQCSCSPKNNFFYKKRKRKFWGKRNQLSTSVYFRKKERNIYRHRSPYATTKYGNQNQLTDVKTNVTTIDSLKQKS